MRKAEFNWIRKTIKGNQAVGAVSALEKKCVLNGIVWNSWCLVKMKSRRLSWVLYVFHSLQLHPLDGWVSGRTTSLPDSQIWHVTGVGVCVYALSLSRVWLCESPWTTACRDPLSTELCRREYWRGLLLSPPGDLPDPGVKPSSLALQAESSRLSHLGSPPDMSLVNIKWG